MINQGCIRHMVTNADPRGSAYGFSGISGSAYGLGRHFWVPTAGSAYGIAGSAQGRHRVGTAIQAAAGGFFLENQLQDYFFIKKNNISDSKM